MKNRTTLSLLLGLAALTGCDAPEAVDADELTCEGLKCDEIDGDAVLDASPAHAAAKRLQADALRNDGRIDRVEAVEIAGLARHERGNGAVTSMLRDLSARPEVNADAKAVIDATLTGARPGRVPLDNDVYSVRLGNSRDFVFDDDLFIEADGSVSGDTGLLSHSRGYAQLNAGVLFRSHGSIAPHYTSTADFTEIQRLRNQGPDDALDLAAKTYGLQLDTWNTFDYVANKVHYNPSPNTPFWAGLCHAWTYTALDNRINALVDVDGPTGQRGVWIFGQWLSRADLGNWAMGVANSLSIADATLVDNFMTPEDLFKGIAEFVFDQQAGMRMDVYSDVREGDFQIWNQPVTKATIEVETIADEVLVDAIVAFAEADASRWSPLPPVTGVKLARLTADWGVEVTDSYEGEARFRQSHWNMYLLTTSDGRVVEGYMAFELANVAGLPETESDGLPDYIAYPKHEATDAAMAGVPMALLDGSSEGPRLRFFVGTVLARGIPDVTRRAFEQEVLAAGASDPEVIAARYPGIANAYSPEQWTRVFEPELGPGEDFGAVWGQFRR